MPARVAPRRKEKLRPKTEADEPTFRDRARGALLGLSVGEALGVAAEGKHYQANLFPALNEYPLDDLKGGGARELKRGQASWSTHLAVCLASSLRTERAFDVVAAGKSYAKWLATDFGAGEVTRAALELIAEGRSPEFTGRRVFTEGRLRAADNDTLARVAPLAIVYARLKDERRQFALDDAAITHFHPLCRAASATFAGVLAAMLTTPKERLAKEDVVKVFETELGAAAASLGQREPDWVQLVKDSAEDLRADFTFARADDPELYGPDLHLFQKPGFVRVSLRLAFWELFHAPDFRAGILDVVNRGGSAESNAAITGALLGAHYGEHGIPEEWREGVLEAASGGGVFWNVYHPRHLLNVVGVAPGSAPEEPE